jgi:hypothetical protein
MQVDGAGCRVHRAALHQLGGGEGFQMQAGGAQQIER